MATPPDSFASTLRVCVVFAVTAVLTTGQLYMVIPLFSAMSASWEVPAVNLTWVASAFAFAFAMGFLIWGPLSDRLGRRRVILFGVAASALAAAVVAAAPGFASGTGLRVLQGIITASFAPSAFAFIAERIEPSKRPIALTVLTSAHLASGILGQVAAQLIVGRTAWQVVFLVAGVGMVLTVPALAWAMPAEQRRPATRSLLSTYRALPTLLRAPRLALLYLSAMTVLAGFVSVYTALQLAGPPGILGSPSALLALRAAGLPAIVLIPFLAPWLSKVAGPIRAGLALFLGAGLALAIGLGDLGAVGLSVLLGVFTGAIAIVAPGLIEAIVAQAGKARGAAVALFTCLLFVGASVGPQIAGALATYGFVTLLVAIGVTLASGGVLAMVAARMRVVPVA